MFLVQKYSEKKSLKMNYEEHIAEVVKKISDNIYEVKLCSSSACSHCKLKGLCNPNGELYTKKVYSSIPLKAGDIVIYDFKKPHIELKAALLAYAIPVIVLFITSIISDLIFKLNLLKVMFPLIFFVSSFYFINRITNNKEHIYLPIVKEKIKKKFFDEK